MDVRWFLTGTQRNIIREYERVCVEREVCQCRQVFLEDCEEVGLAEELGLDLDGMIRYRMKRIIIVTDCGGFPYGNPAHTQSLPIIEANTRLWESSH